MSPRYLVPNVNSKRNWNIKWLSSLTIAITEFLNRQGEAAVMKIKKTLIWKFYIKLIEDRNVSLILVKRADWPSLTIWHMKKMGAAHLIYIDLLDGPD